MLKSGHDIVNPLELPAYPLPVCKPEEPRLKLAVPLFCLFFTSAGLSTALTIGAGGFSGGGGGAGGGTGSGITIVVGLLHIITSHLVRHQKGTPSYQ
jgi:hypothetical protein